MFKAHAKKGISLNSLHKFFICKACVTNNVATVTRFCICVHDRQQALKVRFYMCKPVGLH